MARFARILARSARLKREEMSIFAM